MYHQLPKKGHVCAFCAPLWQTAISDASGVEFDASTPSLP
jgi:hypothetical protein